MNMKFNIYDTNASKEQVQWAFIRSSIHHQRICAYVTIMIRFVF